MAVWNEGIRFRHLAIFLEVASRLSFVRTAEALGITQPSVSRAISELEEAVGVRLLQRSRRGVWLTPEGETFRHHAGAAISSIRRGVVAAQDSSGEGKSFRIGALPTVAGRLVPEAVKLLGDRGFGVQLHVLTGPNTYLLGELKNGELDVVVGRLPASDTMRGLEFERLFSERIVLVTRAGHPMVRPHVSLDELLDYTVLLPDARALIYHQIHEILVGAGLPQLTNVIWTVSPAFAVAFLEKTDAVWIISQSVVQSQLDEGRLAVVPLDTGAALGPVGLTWQLDRGPTPFREPVSAAFRTAAKRLYPDEDEAR